MSVLSIQLKREVNIKSKQVIRGKEKNKAKDIIKEMDTSAEFTPETLKLS